MIRRLAIQNLAVIESVAVDFESAFNILTGETGAGKSILVEAVGLLLGGRASQDLVRTGENLAVVEAHFEIDGTGGREPIVVRREITAEGRSRAFVSGKPTTTAALRELAHRLVELHGQHEHQQLLDSTQHLAILDGWAGLQSRQRHVAALFLSVRALKEQLDRLRMDSRERSARLELIDFQLGELNKAAVRPGEDEELAAHRQVLRGADRIERLCRESYALLYEGEESALAGLAAIWKRVGELTELDGRFAPYLEQRDRMKAELEDLAFALRDFAAGIDLTPGRLEEVETRLAILERLKRKHGPGLEDVIRRRDELVAEREALTGTTTASTIEGQLETATAAFLHEARGLSALRRQHAQKFATALEAELGELAMERTRFEVRLRASEDPEQWSTTGLDWGEFYFSPNPGEDLRPLARIVSGGELSRVMLALKTLASADRTDKTLIFDEVDAGISGGVAAVVGDKLRRLGETFQVLCITHLPQIAAAGSTHFHIEKTVRGDRTVTTVDRLEKRERVDELARMLAGVNVTERVRAIARELLETSTTPTASGSRAKGESPLERKRK
jgi:DNA repair protein RecN (Recombination protein N)